MPDDRCCEKTMEVMRAHQESLMTIVQVLLHDPLSEWTLSPQRAYALQGQRERRDCDATDLNVTLAANADTDLDVDGGDKPGREGRWGGGEEGGRIASSSACCRSDSPVQSLRLMVIWLTGYSLLAV